MTDILQRFVFENTPIRGELVRLDAAWQEVLSRHDYPQPVRDRLGEMLVAAQLLAATLKFHGSLILQIQGDGPVTLMVAEATAQRTVRGMAQWQGDVPEDELPAQFGNGRLAITIDAGRGGERYQGIVELTGSSLSEAIEEYLVRSEQLPTRLWLAADGLHAGGLLLQKLPGAQDGEDEDWSRLQLLAATIRNEEMLGLSAMEIVHRLFHEEDVRLFDAEAIHFFCSCSRERVAAMLASLGEAEIEDILQAEGMIDVSCQFCNKLYRFDAVDAAGLFVEGMAGISPTRH